MKKQMLFIAALSIALIGCGNRNGVSPSEEMESKVNIEDNTQSEDSDAASTQEKSSADLDREDESLETDSEYSGTDEKYADASQEAVDDRNNENTTGTGIAAFGNKETMDNNVNGRELPIYCVDTEEKKVALSFDAAWGNEDTKEILKILKEHGVHVTFFMTGDWVESYPDDVKAILAAGHDLGNHTENHKNMSALSDEDKKEELMSVHRKVQDITGYEMFLFRPPYGDYDNAVIDVAKDCGYYAIQWDVDSLDWQNKGLDAIIETVTEHKNLGNGSIILCHNGAEYIAAALDTLLSSLEEQGYKIIPISELIYQENFHMNYEGRQIKNAESVS